jgi:REP element-mobilizing transposase RayT
MARQWRIEYPGARYHVLSRGNSGQSIFRTDDDRRLFLSLLEELSARFRIELNAYVLMGNHYHLLLNTAEANLSTAMQWFGTTYTRKFNIANQLNGHLFQGRFKSILVQNDAYLLRLSCYIHRNPLRAGIVERLADYPWSSYLHYAYKKKAPAWLRTDMILNQLCSDANRHKAYRIKVQEYCDESGSIWEDVKHGLIIGSQDFVADIKARFLGDSKDAELPQHNSLFSEFDPVLLLDKACTVLGFDLAAVRSKPKIGLHEKDSRDLLIYLLWQSGRLSNYAIGEYFGLTYSAISRRVKIVHERMASDKKLLDQYETLKSQIKV